MCFTPSPPLPSPVPQWREVGGSWELVHVGTILRVFHRLFWLHWHYLAYHRLSFASDFPLIWLFALVCLFPSFLKDLHLTVSLMRGETMIELLSAFSCGILLLWSLGAPSLWKCLGMCNISANISSMCYCTWFVYWPCRAMLLGRCLFDESTFFTWEKTDLRQELWGKILSES